MKHVSLDALQGAFILKDSGDDDPAALVQKALDDLRKSVETKSGETAELVTRLDQIEARLNRPGAAGASNETAIERKAFDHYLRRYGTANFQLEEIKALNTTDEGAVVPQNFLAEIIKDITEFSPMRSLARITNANGSSAILPRRLTKPTAGVVAEGASPAGSGSTYGQWNIPIYEVREFTDISNQLIEDAGVDMEAEIRADLAEAFGEKEGNLFFTGSGVNEPLGLLNDPDFATISAASIAIDADELIDLFYAVKTTYSRRGAWGMNRAVIKAARKLKDSTGNYLWQDGLAAGQPATFLGAPVVEVPTLGDVAANAVPVVFGDWDRGFRVLDRVAMTVLPDRFTRASNGEVRFHARRRFGGKLVRPEALIGLKMPAA